MKHLRAKLSYANVIATLALFLALGGGAYAATALPADSVGSRQIKLGAVESAAVADGSLRAADFAPGDEPITKVVRRYGPSATIKAGASDDVTAPCHKGERALGGGGLPQMGFHENFSLYRSSPVVSGKPRLGGGEPDGWEVGYYNRSERSGDDSVIEVTAYVVCGS